MTGTFKNLGIGTEHTPQDHPTNKKAPANQDSGGTFRPGSGRVVSYEDYHTMLQ
ncbi:hypothetical protein VC83_00003 [Pseudogymnoascus destructans]|uniref:Uncharacterized protein n=1 Tax=Pseudogymnoascus destructans TaxID=655981 RepID=A0A177AMG5_9PEZI|nr:uncharacterized protein VC83_07739 [Pseudogymnoascus destructans]XP_024328515.1 uncharacterized protein VC83_00003 [Pseudogymnoascus destructans]OAF55705.1 hypothetical protein VC83_07739 [Pseudogymnoascus destructans]OAF63246.1 hypothetical protein VC83_00003 [Pseudogymnoascus destructans]